jgi:hypothetical protein
LEFHEASDLDINPITFTFNSVINAWVNSCDPSQQEDKPKRSWTNTCDPSVGKQAKETILDSMLEFHEAGDPDVNRPRYYCFQLYIEFMAAES